MIDNTALLSELYSIQESYSVEQTAINQTDKRCVIDVKERTINIPIEIESLGVQYDHRSYKLLFEIDRYVHGVDLLTQTCVIQWLSKNGTTERSGLHPVVEIEAIDNDKLLFVWELYEDETRIPGVILFAVNFYTMKDENSFLWSYNTLPAQSIIQDTLDVVINPSDEITPSLLMVWNDKMTSIEKLARDSVSTSSRSAHEAEAWAHGRTDFPNTMLDNAKYYKDLTQALYDEAKDALSEEKDRVVEEAKDEIVNLAKDEVIAVVKNEVTDDVINDVYAAKNDSIAAINDTTTSAIQEVEQSKNNAINDLFATGDQRYAVKGSIPTKVSELENDRNYLTEVPDAPVKSVNGKTGDVDLSAEDVGAVTYEEFTEFKVDYDNHTHTAADVGAATSEEVTQLKSDLNEETAERKAEIAVERERINQFTRLEEGGTTGDAELIDARIDYKGITHDNVGEHIRYVMSALNNDIVQLNDGNYFDKYEISNYELGYLNPKNGDNNDLEATDIRIRNNRAWWLKKGSIIKSETGWSFWFAIFNKNKGLTKITAPNYTDKYIVDEDCYIKLSIRKNDNSSLVEYVDSANEYIHVYYPVYNIYQGITLTDGICTVKASDWVNNTDNASDEIENMIAFTASFSNRKIVFDKDVTINRAILLPSNTEVVIDNCTITQADYTFDNVFRGANVILDSTQLAYVPRVIDKIENITIRGEGTANIYGPSINKKDGNADMVGHTYGARTHQIDFCNVNNFKLSGIEFYKTRGWTIELEFVTNFEVSNIVFHTGATQNGDGLDVRGGCAYGKIFNLSGSTGDDMIAFNTHVSLNSPQFNKYPNSTAKYPLEFGYLFNIEECYKNKNASDIHDISIENVSKDGGRYHLVIFLAQYGHKIYNVSMEKLRMNKDYVSAGDNSIISFYNYNEKDFADGDISNIRMNDVECSATHPYSTDPVAVIYSSLKLKNVWANKVVQKNSGDVVSNLKYMDGVTITNS